MINLKRSGVHTCTSTNPRSPIDLLTLLGRTCLAYSRGEYLAAYNPPVTYRRRRGVLTHA